MPTTQFPTRNTDPRDTHAGGERIDQTEIRKGDIIHSVVKSPFGKQAREIIYEASRDGDTYWSPVGGLKLYLVEETYAVPTKPGIYYSATGHVYYLAHTREWYYLQRKQIRVHDISEPLELDDLPERLYPHIVP